MAMVNKIILSNVNQNSLQGTKKAGKGLATRSIIFKQVQKTQIALNKIGAKALRKMEFLDKKSQIGIPG